MDMTYLEKLRKAFPPTDFRRVPHDFSRMPIADSLREVRPPSIHDGCAPSGIPCPSCGGPMTEGPIPCPDGKPGCLVVHFGVRCTKCGKMFSRGG